MGNDPMNWRRGLYRLWLVFSVLFAIGTFAVSFNYIKGEFDDLSFKEATKNVVTVLVDCSLARGAEKTDYIKNLDPYPPNACWYDLPKFRRLYPEYADLTDGQLIGTKLHPKVGITSQKWDPSPIRAILLAAGIAIGVPRSASIGYHIGLGLCWIFQGRCGANA
jgi:hypothetical protein